MKTFLLLAALLLADGQPPSSCQVTPVQDPATGLWVNLYSNCGPPSEHAPGDNASPS